MLRLLSLAAAFLTSLTGPPAPPTTAPAQTHRIVAPAKPAAPARVVTPRPRAVSRVVPPVQGADVSWPNCRPSEGIAGRHGYNLPMPTKAARYVVLGATNGPAWTRNPCLARQMAWAKARHLPVAAYAVIHYPTRNELIRNGGKGTLTTRLRHAGAAQARHALATLRAAHVPTPMVWVDIETVGGHPWSRSAAANQAVLTGVFAQYRSAHVRTGLYSYKHAWNTIMGGRRLPSVPTWVPSGGTTRSAALRKCRMPSFSGGRVVMTQWTTGSRDHNITCPGVRANGLFRKA